VFNQLTALMGALPAYLRAFYLALSLLTRLPVPHFMMVHPRELGLSALFYPFIGLIIGLLLCVPIIVGDWLTLTTQPFLLAALVAVMWAMITGALHYDGLADSTDAWLGGLGDDEKTHRIMKDPTVGSMGVVAIVGVLLLKTAALYTLIQNDAWLAIILAPVLGRAFILILMLSTPYIRKEGLSKDIVSHLPRFAAYVMVAISLLLMLWISFFALVLSLLVLYLLRRLMQQRLQGYTGDTLGASVEIGEMMWLIAVALLVF